jgi:hypothetical protein
MNKSKSLKNFFLTVIITLSLMLLSLVRSENFSWPDAVHTSYGFPLFWLTHQVSSIAGPVDLWHVHPMDLTVNLLFWFGIASLILWTFNKFKNELSIKI